MIQIYAENFRGFKSVGLDLVDVSFLTGDNSSGKTSIIYLVDLILSTGLSDSLVLRHENVGAYDYFSPYFKYSDVLMGYSSGGDEPQYKFITIKRVPQGVTVTRVTVARRGHALTLVAGRNGVRSRLVPIEQPADIARVVSLHKSNSGLSQSDVEYDISVPLNRTEQIVRYSAKYLKDARYGDIFLTVVAPSKLPDASFVAALRAEPALYYSLERRVQRRGEHFAAMAHDMQTLLPDQQKVEALDTLREFGRNSGLFDDVKFIIDKKRKGRSPVYVDIYRGQKVLALSQLGFGLSQVMPILSELIFSKYFRERCVICLQQPELHLHPRAQAAFGEVFLQLASETERLVIETHSDYLIDRFRSELAKRDSALTASIIFCQHSDVGNVATSIEIKRDGSLASVPEGYRDFFMAELARTL